MQRTRWHCTAPQWCQVNDVFVCFKAGDTPGRVFHQLVRIQRFGFKCGSPSLLGITDEQPSTQWLGLLPAGTPPAPLFPGSAEGKVTPLSGQCHPSCSLCPRVSATNLSGYLHVHAGLITRTTHCCSPCQGLCSNCCLCPQFTALQFRACILASPISIPPVFMLLVFGIPSLLRTSH